MIEKVLVLNLPGRIDKRWSAFGHLITIGTPRNLIEIYPAKRGLDWKDTLHIQLDAAKDGFAFIRSNWYIRDDERIQVSYLWSWCSMLRRVIESKQISLIILDDRMLTIRFMELCGIVHQIIRQDLPFHALQLQAECFDSSITLEAHDDTSIGETRTIEPDNMRIGEGFGGNGDYATVVSPEGAQRLLDIIAERPFITPERIFYEQSKPYDKSGVYHHQDGVVRNYGFMFDGADGYSH